MSLPELVTIHTSLLTDLGDAVRERFGVSGDLTIDEMTDLVSLVPSQYRKITYIETSGTQYIDTGLTRHDIADAELDMQYTVVNANSLNGIFLGQDKNWQSFGFGAAEGVFMFQYPRTTTSSDLLRNGSANTNRNVLKASLLEKKFYVNGSAVSASMNTTRSSENTVHFLIGARSNPTTTGGIEPWCWEKIYEFKAWGWNGVLVMDLLPVIRISDSTAGMYDIVNRQFYTNAGTGTFITP